MVKKVLSVAAAAAIAVTGASAFDIFDDAVNSNGILPYRFSTTINSTATTPISVARKGAGDALLFPVFYVGNGWETHIRVINTNTTNAVVAKVVFYSGKDSQELRDFNIYLSAGDVWTGTLKIDADGKARVISTDDSAPLTDGTMASANKPFKSDPIDMPAGYIEVIGCASTVDSNNNLFGVPVGALVKNASAHKDHMALRKAYQFAAKNTRGINGAVVFQNGMITSGALDPNVKVTTSIAGGDTTDQVPDYYFGPVANDLVGDVRITDTQNAKDMVMPAIVLQNVTEDDSDNDLSNGYTNPQALLFVEGEAANIADRALTGIDNAAGATANNAHRTSSEYYYQTLRNDMAEFNTSQIWMTYGDTTSYVNNQLVLTSPYKRISIIADANSAVNNSTETALQSNGNMNVIGSIYAGVKGQNGKITNFGYFSALALVFNESEDQVQASQFSPANTPKLNFAYEVSASENNPADTDNISYYLNQAGSNFARGYILLNFIYNGVQVNVPTVPTQMMATDVNNRVITNWIVPANR